MLTFIVQISNANFRLVPNHSLTIELQSINQVKSQKNANKHSWIKEESATASFSVRFSGRTDDSYLRFPYISGCECH